MMLSHHPGFYMKYVLPQEINYGDHMGLKKHSMAIVTSKSARAHMHTIWAAQSLLRTLQVFKIKIMVWDHPQGTYMKYLSQLEIN